MSRTPHLRWAKRLDDATSEAGAYASQRRSTHTVPRALPKARGFAGAALSFQENGEENFCMRAAERERKKKKSFEMNPTCLPVMKIFGQKHVCLRTCALLLYTPM